MPPRRRVSASRSSRYPLLQEVKASGVHQPDGRTQPVTLPTRVVESPRVEFE